MTKEQTETLLAEAVQALEEIVAEIDAGNLGRLTSIQGMPSWAESAGTEMARGFLAKRSALEAIDAAMAAPDPAPAVGLIGQIADSLGLADWNANGDPSRPPRRDRRRT